MKTPVSPQEWYETGVLLRQQERFGEAINAFARAAECASEEMARIRASSSGGAVPQECEGKISALEKIRAAALASIELIREITSFANTDLMNP